MPPFAHGSTGSVARPGTERAIVTPDVAAEPAVLSARGIRVVVDGDRSGALRRRRSARGLEAFSLDVRPGEVVHLVGDRTSGIVEAIEVLCGHRTPDAGRLLLAGQDVTEPGRRSRALWTGVAVLGAPPAAASTVMFAVELAFGVTASV